MILRQITQAVFLGILLLTGCLAKLPYIIKYNCETNAPIRPEWMNDIIPENYTHLLPPNPDGCPTYVRVDIVPFSLGRVSIPDLTFDMDLYVGLIWEDVRLSIPYNFSFEIGLDAETASLIWTPIVSFRNSHSSRGIIKFDPQKDKLKLKGRRLFYYVRRFVKFHCNYDISLYPMDKQLCNIEVQSVGDERDTVILLDHVHYYDLLSHSAPTEFTLSEFASGTCQRPDFTAPALTCIEYRFLLERRCGDHYLITYVPSSLIVILSWLVFWIDANFTAPRLTIGITAMLTTMVHFAIELKEIPPVSYVKAIDIWIFGCIFMLFLSIIETSLASVYIRFKKKRMESQWGLRRREQVVPYVSPPEEMSDQPERQADNHPIHVSEQRARTSRQRAGSDLPAIERPIILDESVKDRGRHFPKDTHAMPMDLDNFVDKIARIAFPLVFILFNICYWSYYQSKEITLPKDID